MTKKRILVTSALPYANGSIHIGHLVEYIQTDILVRALKLNGSDAIYCCADDTHGTAIEIGAAKRGITPEQFIKECYDDHTKDFSQFHIRFDSYYTTNSPENRKYTEEIFLALKNKGHIYTKDIELTYCEKCKRFLPDRYVKGKCPKCGAEDQYGDVCESCDTAYKTTDLVEPFCVICKSKPIRKMSNHYFFRLSSFSGWLEKWLSENKNLQPEVKNQVLGWVKGGLEDWNISRDEPYFGFKIPGEEHKYFYVWLDAPVGYIASTANYCKGKSITAEDYWKKPGTEIIQIIGKDIIYFHLLFWPTVLYAAGFNVPDSIIVHGFLTVNGEKMSKSRGTFLNASEAIGLLNPEHLRYYYASNLTRTMSDLNLDLGDYRDKINNELVANIANFFYRVLSFCNKNFDSEVLPAEAEFISRFDKDNQRVIDSLLDMEYRNAIRQITHLSSLGNKYFQDNKPWELIKADRARAQQVVSNSVNLVKNINILLKPILPVFAEQIETQLNKTNLTHADLGKNLGKHKIGDAKILMRNIDRIQLKAEDPLSYLDLRVAEIKSAKNHPDADKLVILEIDLGAETRTIAAGIRKHYTDQDLVGKKIVVVKNLKPAILRGVESKGMLLAAGTPQGPVILIAEHSKPGDAVYIEGTEQNPKQEITIEDFQKVALYTDSNGHILYNNKKLKTDKGLVEAEGVKEKYRIS